VLRGDKNTWRFINTVGDDDLLDFVTENILHQLAEWLKASFLFFLLLLLFLSVFEVEAFLSARDEFLTIILFHLLDHIFIDWVDKVENFVPTCLETLKEWGGSDGCLGFTSDVVD